MILFMNWTVLGWVTLVELSLHLHASGSGIGSGDLGWYGLYYVNRVIASTYLEFPSLYNSGLNDTGYLQDIWGGEVKVCLMYPMNTVDLRWCYQPSCRSTGLPSAIWGLTQQDHLPGPMDPLLPSWGLGQTHVWLHNKGQMDGEEQTWLPGWPPSVLLWVHFFFWIICTFHDMDDFRE